MAAGHQHSVPEIDHFYHKASLVEFELPVKGFLHFYDNLIIVYGQRMIFFNNVFNYQMIKYPITRNLLKIQKFRKQSALTLIKLY